MIFFMVSTTLTSYTFRDPSFCKEAVVTLRRIRVLHLEDFDNFRDLVKVALARSKGIYSYKGAPDIASAHNALEKYFFHILLLDINMHSENVNDDGGLQLLEELYV